MSLRTKEQTERELRGSRREQEILRDVIKNYGPTSKEDPSKGVYKASIDGKVLSASDSDLLEDEIRQLLSNK